MAFTVKGRYKNLDSRPVALTWNDGRLSGDSVVIECIVAHARDLNGQTVGPVEGPYTTSKHLKSGLSALMILTDALENATVSGDVPTRPDIPADVLG